MHIAPINNFSVVSPSHNTNKRQPAFTSTFVASSIKEESGFLSLMGKRAANSLVKFKKYVENDGRNDTVTIWASPPSGRNEGNYPFNLRITVKSDDSTRTGSLRSDNIYFFTLKRSLNNLYNDIKQKPKTDQGRMETKAILDSL